VEVKKVHRDNEGESIGTATYLAYIRPYRGKSIAKLKYIDKLSPKAKVVRNHQVEQQVCQIRRKYPYSPGKKRHERDYLRVAPDRYHRTKFKIY